MLSAINRHWVGRMRLNGSIALRSAAQSAAALPTTAASSTSRQCPIFSNHRGRSAAGASYESRQRLAPAPAINVNPDERLTKRSYFPGALRESQSDRPGAPRRCAVLVNEWRSRCCRHCRLHAPPRADPSRQAFTGIDRILAFIFPCSGDSRGDTTSPAVPAGLPGPSWLGVWRCVSERWSGKRLTLIADTPAR